MVEQLPVAANVPAVVAAELVGAGNVDDQMPVTTKVDILAEEVAAPGLAVGLPHRRDVVSLSDEASFLADRLQGIQNRLVGILRAAGVLPAGVASLMMMMMMTFITQRGESPGKTKKERKATKSKGRGLEEGG